MQIQDLVSPMQRPAWNAPSISRGALSAMKAAHAGSDNVRTVIPRAIDHDAVSAAFGRNTHRQRSFPESSSASRFTAGAAAFFILSQSAERPER